MMIHGHQKGSDALKYGMVSTLVLQTLRALQSGRTIQTEDVSVLRKGADLLNTIVSGSALLEKKSTVSGIVPSQEGLFAYGHALSVLEKLSLSSKVDDFTEFFISYRNHLERLSKGDKIGDALSQLVMFFEGLAKLFTNEMAEVFYKEAKPPGTMLKEIILPC